MSNLKRDPEAILGFSNTFKIKKNHKEAFRDIMKYSINKCKTPEKKEAFIKYFYVKSQNINENAEKIVEEITDSATSKRFIFVHGYAKNGKTSFANYIEYLCKKENKGILILPTVDFDISIDQFSIEFNQVVKEYFRKFFIYSRIEEKKKIENSRYFFSLQLLKVFDESSESENTTHFLTPVHAKLTEFLESILNQISDVEIISKTKQLFVEDSIDSFEITLSESSTLLTFLILAHIFQIAHSTDNLLKDRKAVIFFDNIDEILAPAVKDITENYVTHVCNIMENLDDVLVEKFLELTGVDLIRDITFVFQYRSSNLVNEFARQQNIATARRDNERFKEFFNSPVHTISSVKSSFDIIRTRVDIYKILMREIPDEELCDECIIVDNFLNIIDDNETELKLNEIFRLFNGNRTALEYLPFERINDNILQNSKGFSYLVKGMILHLFLSPYAQSGPNANKMFAIFNSDYTKGKKTCNPARLILTYIFNKTNQEFRNLNTVTSIQKNGVSLIEVLNVLNSLKCQGVHPYTREEIKSSFKEMFSYQIDDYRQFITCTKSTLKEDIEQGKVIDLDGDIDLYFQFIDGKIDIDELKKKVESIRLFYNDSTRYLIEHVITHFEFISVFDVRNDGYIAERFDEDLTELFKTKRLKENNLVKLNFYLRLLKVLEKSIDICKTSIEHYLNNIIETFAPKEYCEDSGYAVHEKFYFDYLISRHITYIDQFRVFILSKSETLNKIAEEDQELKKTINKILLEHISKYLDLFDELYLRIVNSKKGVALSLNDTYKSFQEIRITMETVQLKGYTDFITRININ